MFQLANYLVPTILAEQLVQLDSINKVGQPGTPKEYHWSSLWFNEVIQKLWRYMYDFGFETEIARGANWFCVWWCTISELIWLFLSQILTHFQLNSKGNLSEKVEKPDP